MGSATSTARPGASSPIVILGNNTLGSVSGTGLARSYSYDAYGDVKGDGTHTFDYDDAQTLRCVDCLSGSKVQFDYDAKNLRVRKIKGTTKTYSIYSAKADLYSEYD